MSKRHQYVASGRKTRTGQHRGERHKAKQYLEDTRKGKCRLRVTTNGAKGKPKNVNPCGKKAVRQYLSEHPPIQPVESLGINLRLEDNRRTQLPAGAAVCFCAGDE